MTRRWTLLAGAIALSLAAPQAAFASPEPRRRLVHSRPGRRVRRRLRDLKADADGAVSVPRDASGDVAFVSSTDGRAMLDSDSSTPQGSAQEQLEEHGDAFGIDGTTSKAVVTQTLDSAHRRFGRACRPGRRRRARLRRPAGDEPRRRPGRRLGRVGHHRRHPGARSDVSEAQARRTALAAIAKATTSVPRDLSVTTTGRRLYDPAIVHVADPMGARPVWQFEVTNGSDIRETVLVGTDRGEVALHFNDAPGPSTAHLRQREWAGHLERRPGADLHRRRCAPRSGRGPRRRRRQRRLRQPRRGLRRLSAARPAST